MTMRLDLKVVEQWVTRGARVLDLGCGDGKLLQHLVDTQGVDGMGLEIDAENITTAVAAGLNIVEQDMDRGLANFRDKSFDSVILAHALQAVHNPHLVIEEMTRIGKECVVTFPNFGHWRCRLDLATRGRMPVSRFMPYTWYDTPNIHFCTVRDFEALCHDCGVRILDRSVVTHTRSYSWLANRWPNMFASTAIYRISK
jgi:methionine biosynthesis protein MetW